MKISNTPRLVMLPVPGTAVVFTGWNHKEPLHTWNQRRLFLCCSKCGGSVRQKFLKRCFDIILKNYLSWRFGDFFHEPLYYFLKMLPKPTLFKLYGIIFRFYFVWTIKNQITVKIMHWNAESIMLCNFILAISQGLYQTSGEGLHFFFF